MTAALPHPDLAALHPLVQRLVRDFDARVVTPDTFDAWAAEGGDRVLLLGGDPVRLRLSRCRTRLFGLLLQL